jgi:hypothetical protein
MAQQKNLSNFSNFAIKVTKWIAGKHYSYTCTISRTLISEQHSSDTNPLFELAVTPHSLNSISPHSTALTDTIDTHTKG